MSAPSATATLARHEPREMALVNPLITWTLDLDSEEAVDRIAALPDVAGVIADGKPPMPFRGRRPVLWRYPEGFRLELRRYTELLGARRDVWVEGSFLRFADTDGRGSTRVMLRRGRGPTQSWGWMRRALALLTGMILADFGLAAVMGLEAAGLFFGLGGILALSLFLVGFGRAARELRRATTDRDELFEMVTGALAPVRNEALPPVYRG